MGVRERDVGGWLTEYYIILKIITGTGMNDWIKLVTAAQNEKKSKINKIR